MRLSFDIRYAFAAALLFVGLAAIALTLRSGIIRTHIGDVGVVLLIYCAIRAIVKARPSLIVIGTVLFAFLIEFAQLFNLVGHLGLSDNQWARIVLGASFDVWDLVMYVLGGALVLVAEWGLSAGSPRPRIDEA